MDQLNKNRTTVLGLLVILLLIAFSSSQSIAKIKFEESILPILKSNCVQCHGGEKVNGEVDFSKITTQEKADSEFELWETVIEVIEENEMPPEDNPPLSEKEKALFVEWHQEQLETPIESKPGIFKPRRLSGPEYRNTLRSLFGFDLEVAIAQAQQTVTGEKSLVLKLLPKDPPGESGFINDTYASSLSTATLEQYAFRAALNEAIHNAALKAEELGNAIQKK